MVFRQSRVGRQTSLILLLSALGVWAFALWTASSTLGLTLDNLIGQVAALFTDRSPEVETIVPMFLMLVLIVAVPLLIWSILVEALARYEVGEEGLGFRSLGVRLEVPWETIKFVRLNPADSSRAAELITNLDPLAKASRPLLRSLQRQALGRGRLPIFRDIEKRDELIAEIRRRAGVPEPQPRATRGS